MSTRAMLAENIESPMVQELISNTIVRFSIQDNKYILGFVREVVPTLPKATAKEKSQQTQTYEITFQKKIGFDTAKQKQVFKTEKVSTDLELLVQIGDPNKKGSILSKPRRVRISFISNGKPSDSEYSTLLNNFNGKLPLSSEDILRKSNFIN